MYDNLIFMNRNRESELESESKCNIYFVFTKVLYSNADEVKLVLRYFFFCVLSSPFLFVFLHFWDMFFCDFYKFERQVSHVFNPSAIFLYRYIFNVKDGPKNGDLFDVWYLPSSKVYAVKFGTTCKPDIFCIQQCRIKRRI